MRGQMTHLDNDVLAEFRAGLITGRRGTRIAAHLAGCERCTALDEQLAGISVLLASVPAPALPDRVARRLDTALAAEVARRDNPERARGDGAGESAAPARPAGHRGFPPWTWRVLIPAGAAVVLAAGGFGLSQIGHSTTSQSATSSAGGAQATSAARPSASRVNGPATAPIQGAAPRPLRMTPANFVVTTSSTEFGRVTRDARPARAAARLRTQDSWRRHAAAGRDRPLRGRAGYSHRRPHRLGRHSLAGRSRLLGDQP